MALRTFAAVDIGASGGRVMAGRIDNRELHLDTIHRFSNGVIESEGHLRWDLTRIRREMATGLSLVPDAESIGIDTWAVDYGLLDASGELIDQPISYRDSRTTDFIQAVHSLISPEELYAINGLQFLPFNTIFQLASEQESSIWHRADRLALLPDLLSYWLTGELRTEMTNASTTGLLNVRTHEWSQTILDLLHIPESLLPSIEPPGTIRGKTAAGVFVTSVASHDTASAVVAIPATTSHFAYVIVGTWSLVGIELASPVLTESARVANFTNELGVDNRVRFLRNVGGLWLLQECLREWPACNYDELLAKASELPVGGPTVEVRDPDFIAPGGMAARVKEAAGQSDMTPVEITRCIIDSLALAFADTIRQAVGLCGASVEVVHMVAGGSQNVLLCQQTANAVGIPVIAGPVEATALGNVLIQARSHGAAPSSLEDLREIVASSTELRRFEPQ